MSRLVLTQITIKKERSISSTTWYYLLQPSSASAPDSTNYGNPPPTITTEGYSGWSTTEPTYTVGDSRVLYQMVQTIFSDGDFSYTTPTISSSYEAAKAAYNEALQAEADIGDLQELGLQHGYIWYNETAKAASGSIPAYPVGSYIASGINNTINQANSNTYGLNTWISTGGINLRYNAIDLAKLTTSALEFYYPSTLNQGSVAISLGTHGTANSLIFYEFNSTNKKMELTSSNLNFYGSSQSTPDAQLTSTGLVLSKGGITAGEAEPSGFVYLSTEDYPLREFELTSDVAIDTEKQYYVIDNDSNKYVLVTQPVVENIGNYYEVKSTAPGIDINGHNPSQGVNQNNDPAWRQVIGTKFGVDSEGNLYASSANLTGSKIGNWDITDSSIQTGIFNDTESMYFGSQGLSLSDTFQVSSTGSLTAVDGKIGGFTIDEINLYKGELGETDSVWISTGTTNVASIGGSAAIDGWAFTAGDKFGVTNQGILWTSDANISGKVSASEFTAKNNFQILNSQGQTLMKLNGNSLDFYSVNSTQPIASYGNNIIVGDPNHFHITVTADYNQSGEGRLSFYRDATNEVAYISGDKLYIAQSVVLQQMDVGQQMVDNKGGQWSWKIHGNSNGKNNLYLKWIG